MDGVFRLTPIEFGVAGGTVSSRVSVDARGKALAVDLDSTFRKLHIGQLVPQAKLLEKSLGAIDGRTRFKGHGNSVAAVLGSANGRVDLMSGGGQVSNLMIEYAGADIAEIVKFWVGGDRQVELRCGVVTFSVKDGIMASDVFVIDTDDTYFGGTGSVKPARRDARPEDYAAAQGFQLRSCCAARCTYAGRLPIRSSAWTKGAWLHGQGQPCCSD